MELVQDMAMQAAASPSAIVVSTQEVPEDEMEKERQIEMGKEDIQNKPEAIRCVSVLSGSVCLVCAGFYTPLYVGLVVVSVLCVRRHGNSLTAPVLSINT